MVADSGHRLEQSMRLPNHYYELNRMRAPQVQVDEAYDALDCCSATY